MGAEILVPLAISAASTGVGLYNQERAAARADRIAAQGIQQQGVRQRQVDSRVGQVIDSISGSNPAIEQQRQQAEYMDQLRRTRAIARGTPGVAGASDRYTDDLVASDVAVDDNAAKVAELMSRANAPLLQRERELQGFDRARSDIGVISRQAAGDDFLNQLRLRGVRPNPWVDALSQIGQGYARARYLRGGRVPPGTASPSTPGGGIPVNTDDLFAPIPYK